MSSGDAQSRAAQAGTRDAQLNVSNLKTMRAGPPDRFAYIRFDPNNNCNVHCVYCHNERSQELVPTEEFRAFLEQNVLSVENFQTGCGMEPTLDKRLADLLLLVARSPAKPRHDFVLQTNGILLHLHDPGKIREAGLTGLSISIDSADPEIHRALRGGTSMAKVSTNLVNFGRNCPGIAIQFITTVTRLNLPSMEALVRFGMGLGVSHFTFREVFHIPEVDVVDHGRMLELLLLPGEFAAMEEQLRSNFGGQVSFLFADNDFLSEADEKMTADSRLPQSIRGSSHRSRPE